MEDVTYLDDISLGGNSLGGASLDLFSTFDPDEPLDGEQQFGCGNKQQHGRLDSTSIGGHDSLDDLVGDGGGGDDDDGLGDILKGTHDFGIPHSLSLPANMGSVSIRHRDLPSPSEHPFLSGAGGNRTGNAEFPSSSAAATGASSSSGGGNSHFPRFVSCDNVKNLRKQQQRHGGGRGGHSKNSPLDSLRDLVRKKQQKSKHQLQSSSSPSAHAPSVAGSGRARFSAANRLPSVCEDNEEHHHHHDHVGNGGAGSNHGGDGDDAMMNCGTTAGTGGSGSRSSGSFFGNNGSSNGNTNTNVSADDLFGGGGGNHTGMAFSSTPSSSSSPSPFSFASAAAAAAAAPSRGSGNGGLNNKKAGIASIFGSSAIASHLQQKQQQQQQQQGSHHLPQQQQQQQQQNIGSTNIRGSASAASLLQRASNTAAASSTSAPPQPKPLPPSQSFSKVSDALRKKPPAAAAAGLSHNQNHHQRQPQHQQPSSAISPSTSSSSSLSSNGGMSGSGHQPRRQLQGSANAVVGAGGQRGGSSNFASVFGTKPSGGGIASFLKQKKEQQAAANASMARLTSLSSASMIPGQQQQQQPPKPQAQPGQQQQKEQGQQSRTTSAPSETALHMLCCNPNVAVEDVDRALRRDPAAASRSATVHSSRSVYSMSRMASESKIFKEAYTYPLNLALKHRARQDVIEMLVDAAPSVLQEKDGAQQELPLHVLLRFSPQNVDLVDTFLLKCPRAAAAKDRHMNTPLHVACSKGASVDVVRHLCILYYEPLFMRNFHGKTPLELSQQRTSSCTESVAKFLWDEQARRRAAQRTSCS